jgi:MFS family permease
VHSNEPASGPTAAAAPRREDRSYRALLAIPHLGRIVASMQLARIAQSMVGVALVLFTLAEYDSAPLAGLVTFASVFPGLIASPIAGALLDRYGRVRLIALDYVVACAALILLAILSAADSLPAPLLVAIAAVSSLTGILSHTGLRSLFPIIVPRHLWERINAVDSNGYVVATLLGPPIAAALVALLGPQVGLALIAVPFLLGAVALVGIADPAAPGGSPGRLLAAAWAGVRYTWRNRTLRGLGMSISVANLAGGMVSIVIPLVVLQGLGLSEALVGIAFATSGLSGMVSAFIFGRMDTRDREWLMLVVSLVLMAPAVALLLPASGAFGPVDPVVGLALVIASQVLFGFLAGPLDIALFTVRQRRTDPAMLGRAFAVSMAFNFLGFPIGAALTGALAASSLPAAIGLGVVASLAGAALAAGMIPAREDTESHRPA